MIEVATKNLPMTTPSLVGGGVVGPTAGLIAERDLIEGGYIKWKGHYYKVKGTNVTLGRISVQEINRSVITFGMPVSEVEPIPITVKWLEKFGFENPETDRWTHAKYLLTPGEMPYWALWSNHEEDPYFLAWLKGIHHLQALLYFLEGIDLSVEK